MCNEQSRCCMHCAHVHEQERLLYCGKRISVASRVTRLVVDAFFVCPLWRPRRRVPYA